MKRIGLSVLLVVLILVLSISVLSDLLNIQRVAATGTIYIREDGTVEPSTAPIENIGNSLYIFKSNIYESIVVERSNIVIDGAGYTLQGTETGAGIRLTSVTNVTIKKVTVEKFIYGIYLYGTSNTTICNNTISNNKWDGIYLVYSDTCVIYDNTVRLNKRYGIVFSESGTNKIFHNNFINNTSQTHLYQSFNNLWDSEYPSGGNYWSDYNGTDFYSGPNQNLTGSDGIGDTPYEIDTNNQDRYPLMRPWSPSPELPGDINGDGVVNFLDAILLGAAFGSTPGSPNWNPNADLNGDLVINFLDAIILGANFGKTA